MMLRFNWYMYHSSGNEDECILKRQKSVCSFASHFGAVANILHVRGDSRGRRGVIENRLFYQEIDRELEFSISFSSALTLLQMDD